MSGMVRADARKRVEAWTPHFFWSCKLTTNVNAIINRRAKALAILEPHDLEPTAAERFYEQFPSPIQHQH